MCHQSLTDSSAPDIFVFLKGMKSSCNVYTTFLSISNNLLQAKLLHITLGSTVCFLPIYIHSELYFYTISSGM